MNIIDLQHQCVTRNRDLLNRFEWYRKRGTRAENALHLARAERYASNHDWVFKWEWDQGSGNIEDICDSDYFN